MRTEMRMDKKLNVDNSVANIKLYIQYIRYIHFWMYG